jgi:hypothetical protein
MDLLDQMRSDFKVFLSCIWHELGLPPPTRAQYAIADYLQHGPKRLQIQAFRGVGKSWIAGAFVLWHLFNDPEKKILIVSASKERADNQSIFIQKLILEVPWLQHLKPSSLDSTARWSRISFDVSCRPSQVPSVKSVGITGQITGSRGDIILLDDVEIPGNSMTEMQREKLLQLVTEVESVIMPTSDSRILFLGTPQTTFTIYRKLAERNYRPFVWPARYPRSIMGYEGLLAPQVQADIDQGAEPWAATDPMRFSDEELLEREVSMGRSNFMLQFMLDTSLSDAEKFPLKFSDLVIMPVNPDKAPDSLVWCSDPRNTLKELPAVGLPGDRFYSPMVIQGEWDSYQETICSVDPSGRGRDETAAAFLSQRHGYIYLHEMFATKDGYSDKTILDILRRCAKYNVTTILIESNFGDGIVCELFRKHLQQTKQHIKVEETRATIRKEDRIIDTLEPVMNQHRLVIDPNVILWDYQSNQDAPPEERLLYMLCYQMSRICREKGALRQDDRLDALSQGVHYFTNILGLSAHEMVKVRRQEEWQETIDQWLDDPLSAANHLALGMSLDQRRRAQGLSGGQRGLIFAGRSSSR